MLEDDRNHFTTERAALTVREETLRAHPQLQELAKALGDKLTEGTVIDLLDTVDRQGRTADEAALHFLRTNGFIGS